MAKKNYSTGKYKVFGLGVDGPLVGRIDEDEYIRAENGTWIFRIDGDEIYGLKGDLVGFVDGDGVATYKGTGQFLFRIEID